MRVDNPVHKVIDYLEARRLESRRGRIRRMEAFLQFTLLRLFLKIIFKAWATFKRKGPY